MALSAERLLEGKNYATLVPNGAKDPGGKLQHHEFLDRLLAHVGVGKIDLFPEIGKSCAWIADRPLGKGELHADTVPACLHHAGLTDVLEDSLIDGTE